MLTLQQKESIREHLDKAQNPVFYYDNDADGLCAFLLARRYVGRGKGVAVKSYPDLNAQYAQKAHEFKADYVFILDKPLVSKEFLDAVELLQLPIVWIDHHELQNTAEKTYPHLFYYNPTTNKGKYKSSEPTTALLYQVTARTQDLWIAIMGCIADHYLPPFAKEFAHDFPEYWGNIKEPFQAYYTTQIGKIAQGLSFGLKDSISNVVHLQNFLLTCKSPADVFAEYESNTSFRQKYSEIRKKYLLLLEKAKDSWFDNLLFFDYSGDLSISAELANELSYLYPDKYITVAYLKGAATNLSLRGKNIKKIVIPLLERFENASGGGHEQAIGARLQTTDLAKFREMLWQKVK